MDKFYTLPEISEKCLSIVGERYEWSHWGLVVEPSAGDGSFLTRIPTPRKVGIDIAPEHRDIINQDFLTYTPSADVGDKVLVVGNPPFGRVSSLAVKFFNHSSKWAHVIAFIVPRTFRRVSVQNRLNRNFRLVLDEEISTTPCAFNPPMMVKCCFQIWERSETKREVVELTTVHKDWVFLKFGPKDEQGQPTPPTGADFAIRAYGGRCGEVVTTNLDRLRPKSWHWIQSKREGLVDRFGTLEPIAFEASQNTARQNSLGRGELVQLYSRQYD